MSLVPWKGGSARHVVGGSSRLVVGIGGSPSQLVGIAAVHSGMPTILMTAGGSIVGGVVHIGVPAILMTAGGAIAGGAVHSGMLTSLSDG